MLWCSCLLLLALSGVATAQAPLPPSNLQIYSFSDRSVSYTFTASPTPGATYRVAFTLTTPRDGIPQPTDDTTDSASLHTKSGLIPDVDYTVQVFAVLNGAESAAVSANFTTLPSVPSGPPQNFRVMSRDTTSIKLTWSDPSLDRINDRDGVRRFVVRRDGVQVATVTAKTYTFTGLRVATSYSFEVLAVNDQGIAPDNHAADLTATTASAVPSSPTLRVVLPRFSNTYLVWSNPEPFAGVITGFQIRYLIDGVPLTIPELGGGVHQYSVSGIKGSEGKTHSVSLRAKTAAGYGHYSDPVVFTFQPIAEVDVTAVDCTTLKVSYTVNPLPGGDKNKASLQSFVVKYQPILGGGSTGTVRVPLKGNPSSGVLCLSGLRHGTSYRVTYNLEAESSLSVQPSDQSEPKLASTRRNCDRPGQCIQTNSNVPDVPAQHVRVDKINSHTLEVSWLEPDLRHIKPGFEITGYRVIVGSSCGEGINKTIPAAQSRWYSVRFPHLEPGTTYCVRVVPGNIAGFALPQSVQSSDQMVDLPEILPAPLIAGVTPHEHHAIVIWEKVESGDEDNPVTEYIIQIETYFDGERMVYRKMFSSSDVQYFFNMTQLAAGRLYAVSVAAQNRLGMGRVGSATFRTLLLTDDHRKSSSYLPEGLDETVPDLGWYQFPPGAEFTVAPRIDTPLPPTDNASPIGPLLKLYQDSKCNDVITRPQYRVPVASEEVGLPKRMSLCYEVQGQVNQTFNLISDTCVSVNALYSPTTSEGTSISKIGVLAKDNVGRCQEIGVDLAECEVRVNGQVVNSTYKQDGVNVRHRGKGKVRIAVPNCKDAIMVIVVTCQARSSAIPFEVSKGTGLGNTSHGLVGQFWNANVVAEEYSVTADDHIDPAPNHYAVTVTSRSGNTRKFFAVHVPRKWDKHSNKCLYAGGTQGGRIYEVPSLPGSVIEGRYDEYAVDGLFDHDYKYSQFTSQCP